MQFVPTKLYYKIREVSEIVGVEAHVLRFWETEFPALAPPKSRTGQRTYRPKDIELLLRIRDLLYEEGYTIAGARKRLGSRVSAAAEKTAAPATGARAGRREAARPEKKGAPARDRLNKVKSELENILTLLDRG
ncbi:MAG: MerR family transcriptional regulator [Acidobacteria bacterium]|nr:MerR family transcriptional regulator [Acidobacteriota bacterium]